MSIELTEAQQRALDREADELRIVDPRSSREYVLIPVEELETVHELLEDERLQRNIRELARRNAAARMESDP